MKNNILYLEKRGCNFWQHDKINEISDVGNYRVCTLSECIRGKDGNIYFLEFNRAESPVQAFIAFGGINTYPNR